MHRWFTRYFIPSEENGYKPHGLQRRAAVGMFFLVIITFSISNIYAVIMIGTEWLTSAVIPAVIVDLTNEERTELAISSLARSPLLDDAATRKAEHMAEHEYFAHHSPDGISPWYWIEQVGYQYIHAGENLAVHFTDSGKVVDAWMNSPGHRDNILNGQYTEIGIGTARGEYKDAPTLFVVQLFATPASGAALVQNDTAALTDTTPPTPAEEGDESGVLSEATDGNEEVSEEPDEEAVDATSSPESQAPVATNTAEATSTPAAPVFEAHEERSAPRRSVYSELSTTSPSFSAAVDARSGGGSGVSAPNANSFLKLLTQPTMWLSIIYLALALYIAVMLTISVVVEWRRQHPVQLSYGVGLLCVLAVLLRVHAELAGGVLIA